jgi:pyridoxine 4-dehydrogenase
MYTTDMIDHRICIGKDLWVNRIGLGTNRIRNNEASELLLAQAVEMGINFIDTAEAYSNHESEETIGKALFPYANGVIIATKGGMRAPDFHIDASAGSLRQSLFGSLKRLRKDVIDVYILHRVDPQVPLRDSIMFLKQMQGEGKIKHIGISHVSIDQIKEARKYVDIAVVENEYNLSDRGSDEVIDYCEKEDIVFIPYFPLHHRFSDSGKLAALEEKYRATESQLALAWLLARSKVILPIPGTLSVKHALENVAAVKIDLTQEDRELLESLAR